MKYNKLNDVFGWFCGLIATTTYILTADRFNSWWDTGEFIASAYKLEVVHQPGAPLFLMIQNLFANLAFDNVANIAFWMNVGSAVCSGMTIVFLFWTITALAKKIILKKDAKASGFQVAQILSAGFVGALSYTFTDTFWYSAVESEVYAMSSLCTAIVFWLILKWEARADEEGANKWLLAIAFVMGLSIGVHLLNLLTIPALALVIYFRKTQKPTTKGVLKVLGIGIFVLAFILWGIIQYSVKIAAYFDLFFVNNLGLFFGSGIIFFVLLLVSCLIWGIYYSIKKVKPTLQLAILSICFVLFGFSSYSMLLIRSQTNISLNNASPDNAFSFLAYLSREQYGSEPLLKGPIYNSNPINSETQYTFRKDEDKYTKIPSMNKYEYDKEMLFPRLYSEKHAPIYSYYLGLSPNQTPTFVDNIKFFFSYQLNHMYARYFLWNFVGRQNDVAGHDNSMSGNWISGWTSLDNRIGGQNALSDDMKADPSRNTYFFLPFILGLIGVYWQIKNQKRDALTVGLLFFFTGIAIVIYLNQTPMQPRERDYAYSGSFYMFAVWIGLGVLGLVHFLRKLKHPKLIMGTALTMGCLGGPILLATQNWDDHDRSDREWTRDMAYNYLQSCEPNAILFTYADNDTFPLWYLQEVEGVREDVRIVNLSYLQSDWYMKQAMQDINQAKKLPFHMDMEKVKKGVRDVIYVHDLEVEGYSELDTLLKIMLSDNKQDQVQFGSGGFVNILPTKKIQLTVDKDSVLRNKAVPADWEDYIAKAMQWEYNKDYVTRAELGMMAILAYNNWERPIYFANMLSSENFIGLEKYLVNEGLVYRLMPIEMNQPHDAITLVNTDSLYRNITEKYDWGNIKDLAHFDADYKNFVSTYFYDYTINEALDSLLKSGDTNKAGNVALMAYHNMPSKVISVRHAYQNTILVDTLFKTKESNKALVLANRDLKYVEEQLNYIHHIGNKLTSFDAREVEMTVDTLNRYKRIAAEVGNKDLIAKVEAMEKKFVVQ